MARRLITIPRDGFDGPSDAYYDFLWVKNATLEGHIIPIGWEGRIECVYRLREDFPIITRWCVSPWNFHLSRRSPRFHSGVSPVRHQLVDGTRELNIRAANGGSGRVFKYGPLRRGVDIHLELNIKFSANPTVGYVELIEDGEVVVPKAFLATHYPGESDCVLWEGLYKPGIRLTRAPNSNDEIAMFELTDAILTPLGGSPLPAPFKTITKGEGRHGSPAPSAVVVPDNPPPPPPPPPPPAPFAFDATYAPENPVVGQAVAFTASCSEPASIVADFGSTQPRQTSPPGATFWEFQKSYVGTGTKTVIVTATLADGRTATETLRIVVTSVPTPPPPPPPPPLTIEIDSPMAAVVGEEVVFRAVLSREADVAVEWDFGPTQPRQSGIEARKAYVGSGQKTVIARADDLTSDDAATDTVLVQVAPAADPPPPAPPAPLPGDGSYLIPDPAAFRSSLAGVAADATARIVAKANAALTAAPHATISNAPGSGGPGEIYTKGNRDFRNALNCGYAFHATGETRYRDRARFILEHYAARYSPRGGHGYPQIRHHVDEGVPINAAAMAFDLVRGRDWSGMPAVQEWFEFFVSRARHLVVGNWRNGNAYPDKGSKGSMFANGNAWAMSQGAGAALAADDLDAVRYFTVQADNMTDASPYLPGRTYNLAYLIEFGIEPSGRVHDELWRKDTDYGEFFLQGPLWIARAVRSLGHDLWHPNVQAAGRWYGGYHTGSRRRPAGYAGSKDDKYTASTGEATYWRWPDDAALLAGVSWGTRAAHAAEPFPSHAAILAPT